MSDCVFCDIIYGRCAPPQRLRYCERGVWRFEPLAPVVPGHLLFVHDVHTETPGELPYITGIVAEAAAEYARLQVVDGYNLIVSSGAAATQSIFHLHFHYVPRHDGDGLTLPWTGQQR